MADLDVIVVGGGISGLASAWELQQLGYRVKVLEQGARTGGKISSSSDAGYLMESAASMVVDFNSQVSRFLTHAGLAKRLVERHGGSRMKRYILHKQGLQSVAEGLPGLMRMPCWSRRARWRMLGEIFVPRSDSDSESVSSFVRRRLGNEVLENAIEPFIAGTWASDPDKANAQSVLPRLTALERRFGSITAGILVNKLRPGNNSGKPRIFSFDQGMETLVKSLAMRLDVATGCGVRRLSRHADSWSAVADTPTGEKIFRARHIVLSIPAPQAAKLMVPIDTALSGLLTGIDYASMSVVHMGFERSTVEHPLNGGGFLAPRHAGLSVNGNLWQSSAFPGRARDGKTLLTAYVGGARNPDAVNWDDVRIIGKVLADLKPLLGIRGDPEIVRINRHAQALPLYYGDYARRQREIAGRLQHLPGLYLQANYLGGISVRDRLNQATTLAAAIKATRKDDGMCLVAEREHFAVQSTIA